MDKTYLRYECADTFSLTIPTSSHTNPLTLAFSPGTTINNTNLLLPSGSYISSLNLRTGDEPLRKYGQSNGEVIGSGNALNEEECCCLDSFGGVVVSGWSDGAVRLFTLDSKKDTKETKPHSLEIPKSDPLVLNGHTGAVRVVQLERTNTDKTTVIGRCASGGGNGRIVLWDLVSETGLYRLTGHTGRITHLRFWASTTQGNTRNDMLISSGVDGLVKIWDLGEQCCVQTLSTGGLGGEVWAMNVVNYVDKEEEKWRLVTGCNDVQIRFWDLEHKDVKDGDAMDDDSQTNTDETTLPATYMGSIHRPPSQVSSHISQIQFHNSHQYMGISYHNSRIIDLYKVLSPHESEAKHKRRLKRQREKENKKKGDKAEPTPTRGILDEDDDDDADDNAVDLLDPEAPQKVATRIANDELEYLGSAKTSGKCRGFTFCPGVKKSSTGGNDNANNTTIRIVCGLSNNSIEVHSVDMVQVDNKQTSVSINKSSTLVMYGHSTGIRSLNLSSSDEVAVTLSKQSLKLWNVPKRSCIRSISLNESYGLCCRFLSVNGKEDVLVGTRSGGLKLLDVDSGEIMCEVNAHEREIWDLDIMTTPTTTTIMTGSADQTVKFWEVENTDNETNLVHTRTLQMKDDVLSVRFSNTTDLEKKLVAVSTLDSTVKVFFADSLKFFLNLYGHSLPALCMDIDSEDDILISGGADKSIKIWGLEFGDTHRTLYGHSDSITCLKFAKRSHLFFSASKDKTIRYWDADSFQQILLLNGHCAEVNTVVVAKSGGFLLSGGMDRQVRVWERSRDIVFLEEERERELEKMLDAQDRGEKEGANRNEEDEDEEQPQSEAAVKKSVLSVAGGDRIMEALELADQETRELLLLSKTSSKPVTNNPLLIGMTPPQYILFILKSIKPSLLEQSLLVLPLHHLERLLYYLLILLRRGMGVELCAKVVVFLIKSHQHQIVSNHNLSIPLRELRKLLRNRLSQNQDTIGFNLAGLRAVSQFHQEKAQAFAGIGDELPGDDVWAGLGFGSDVAAALVSKKKSGSGDKKRQRKE